MGRGFVFVSGELESLSAPDGENRKGSSYSTSYKRGKLTF